jgi:hypothetical protein
MIKILRAFQFVRPIERGDETNDSSGLESKLGQFRKEVEMGTFGKMIILALIGLTAIPSGADAITTTFTDTGTLPAAITDTVDAFRAALGGGLNPNNPVSFTSGRREINWDGVPDGMPCMTYDLSVKVRPWEFGSSPM